MPKFIPDMLLLLVKIFQIIMCVQLLRVAGFNMTITGGQSIRTFKYLFVSLRTKHLLQMSNEEVYAEK